MPAKAPKPLWRCPKCGARFVTRNLWHSCGKFTLEALFAKSEPHVLPLFKKYAAFVRRLGRGVLMVPQKTRVVFMERVRFVGVYPRKQGFDAGLVCLRPIIHERIVKHQFYAPCYHVNTVRIATEADLDATLLGWLR
jgi:hypothetical protein